MQSKLARLLFFTVALAILIFALLPASVRLPSTGWDKSNHVLAFGVLAYMGCKAFPQSGYWLWGMLTMYGGVIEVLQYFTPSRSAEWADLLADAIGALIGLKLAKWV